MSGFALVLPLLESLENGVVKRWVMLFATYATGSGDRARLSFGAGGGQVRVGLQAGGTDPFFVHGVVHGLRPLVFLALIGTVGGVWSTPAASLEHWARRGLGRWFSSGFRPFLGF